MGKALVIVESPAKARTIAGLLGPDFIVESSVGHIRDLPRGAEEVPAAFKGEGWARLGVDVDNGFKPLYVVSPRQEVGGRQPQAPAQGCGRALPRHGRGPRRRVDRLASFEVLSPRVPVKRMVFHEITPPAIERAVEEWRELDRRLVDAQEARRILDRLYGYEVSPVLWRKVMPRLSAGRVQSVATRMVVERERARMRFRAATWWGVDGTFAAPETGSDSSGSEAPPTFGAALVALEGTTLATGRDFAPTGERGGAGRRRGCSWSPRHVRWPRAWWAGRSPCARSPSGPFAGPRRLPFMTSTLQQEAGRKLRFRRAARDAGRPAPLRAGVDHLHADGLDDAVRRGARRRPFAGHCPVRQAVRARRAPTLRAQGEERAGGARGRPARRGQLPHTRRGGAFLAGDERRLYELIWKRTVASQMADATGTSAQVRLVGTAGEEAGSLAGAEAEFSASGRVITFPGFLRAYVEGEDDPEAELADREVLLPPLADGDSLDAVGASSPDRTPPSLPPGTPRHRW